MKRKTTSTSQPKWINKLDVPGQQFVAGLRYVKQFEKNCADPIKRAQFIELVQARLPGFLLKEEVDISPALLNSLKTAGFPLWAGATTGKQVLGAGKARFVSSVGSITEIMDAPEFRKYFPVAGGFLLTIFQNFFDQIAIQNFGTGKLTIEQASWTVGTILITAGHLLRGEKGFEKLGKGRANAELLQILRILRTHQIKKLMPKEIKQMLDYVGIHVSDAESLRIFEWRAKKKGQL
jgi:hypothetical protein